MAPCWCWAATTRSWPRCWPWTGSRPPGSGPAGTATPPRRRSPASRPTRRRARSARRSAPACSTTCSRTGPCACSPRYAGRSSQGAGWSRPWPTRPRTRSWRGAPGATRPSPASTTHSFSPTSATRPDLPPWLLGDEPVVHPELAEAIGGAVAKLGLEHHYFGRPAGEPHDPAFAYNLAHVLKTVADRLAETQAAARGIALSHRALARALHEPAEVYVVAARPPD